MRMRLSTLLLMVALFSVLLAWWMDRQKLVALIVNCEDRLQRAEVPPIAWYGEKYQFWSPSLYLKLGSRELEARLSHRISCFDGEEGVSPHGFSNYILRRPTKKTIEKTLEIAIDSKDLDRIHALRLLSLYLEAVSGRNVSGKNCFETRVFFQMFVKPELVKLLVDSEPEVREAAAYTLGNLVDDNTIINEIKKCFALEKNRRVKIAFAWVYNRGKE